VAVHERESFKSPEPDDRPGGAEPVYVETGEMFRPEALAAAARTVDQGEVLQIAPRRVSSALWWIALGLAGSVIAMSWVSVDRAVSGFVIASKRNGLVGTAVFPGEVRSLLRAGQPLELRDEAGATQTVRIERVDPAPYPREQLAGLLPREVLGNPQRGSFALAHVSLSAAQPLDGEIVHARVVVGRDTLLVAMIPELRRVLP
jgi:hypothetical protein